MLRVLLVPRFHTSPKITGCSGANTLRWFLEELGRNSRANTTVWMGKGLDASDVPKEEARMKYVTGSRTWKHTIRCDTVETDDEFIELLHSKKIEADVILTDFHFTQGYHSLIQYEASFGMNIPATVPIVTWFNESVGQDSLAYFKLPAAVPQLALAALAGELIFCTEYVRREFARACTSTFGASFVRRMQDAPVILPGLDTAATDFDVICQKNAERRAANPGRVPLVFNAAALSPRRRFDTLIEAVGKVNSSGRKMNVRFYTQIDRMPDYVKAPYVESRAGVPRKDLLSVLHKSDIVYEGNTFEGTALFLFESVMAGALPVFLRDGKTVDWMAGRMPENYPFVAKNAEDLSAKLFWLAENIDAPETVKARDEMRNFVKKDVDQRSKADQWVSELGKVIRRSYDPAKFRRSIFGELMLLAKETAPGKLTSSDAGKLANKLSKKGSVDPHKILSTIAFRRLMQACGFRDVGSVDEALWEVGDEEWLTEAG